MKKTMLIGRTGCGKTTLTQKLMNEEVKYKKTQSVTYKSKIIDTPGEYVENKMYYKSLLVLSADAKLIVLVQSAIDGATLFPPKFSTMFPRKEVIGVITKTDLENANVERSRKFLVEAGVTEVFTIGLDEEKTNAIGILTITPGEAAIISADIAIKSGSIELGFLDRFSGTLLLTGDFASVESSLKAVLAFLQETLKFYVCDITRS